MNNFGDDFCVELFCIFIALIFIYMLHSYEISQ